MSPEKSGQSSRTREALRNADINRLLISKTAVQIEQRIATLIESLPQNDEAHDGERIDQILSSAMSDAVSRFEVKTAELIAGLHHGGKPQAAEPTIQQVASELQGLNACIEELMSQLREKEKTLERYVEGYDAHVFKRFLRGFVIVADAIDGLIDSDLSKEDALRRLQQLLVEEALDDCGVEVFSPDAGTLFRSSGDVDDTIQVVPTDDRAKDGVIESTFRPGYRLRPAQPGSNPSVILKAKVRVFAHRNEEKAT